ncbi:MAG: bactofilin family protein [Acidiferrobacterales bacterium]
MLEALSKKSSEKPCNTIDTLVGARTELKGDIVFTGGLRVDGKIRGNITASGEENSTLVLSENGMITGDVTVPHIIINGKINGNVHASGRIEIQPKAEITGDLVYRVLEIAAGAVITGAVKRDLADKSAVVARLKPTDAVGVRPEANKSG